MTHIYGVPLAENYKLGKTLCSVPGIGHSTVINLLKKLGLSTQTNWSSLTLSQKLSVKNHLEILSQNNKKRFFGVELVHEKRLRTDFLLNLGSRRGIRLREGLPVRGQNTHSNARTAKHKNN